MNRGQGSLDAINFQSPREVAKLTQRNIRVFLLSAGVTLSLFGVAAYGIIDALGTSLKLARLHHVQVKNFDRISANFGLLFTLDESKSHSTISAIKTKNKKLLVDIEELQQEAVDTLENMSLPASIVFPNAINSKLFTANEKDMSVFRSMLHAVENEGILGDITRVVYLRPIESGIIHSQPWLIRFEEQAEIIASSLKRLAKLEGVLLVFGPLLLVLAYMLVYFFAFRPSFTYLNRVLDRQSKATDLRASLISMTKELTVNLDDPAQSISKTLEGLTESAKNQIGIDGTSFERTDEESYFKLNQDSDRSVISLVPITSDEKEYLKATLPAEFSSLKDDIIPYIDVISQHLRLQFELKMRHRAESDRDDFLHLSWAILESLPNPIFVMKNDRVTMVNPSACAFFGLYQSNILNITKKEISELHQTVHQPKREEYTFESLSEALNGTHLFHYESGTSYEWQKNKIRDGEEIYVGRDFTTILSNLAAQEQKRKLETMGKISGTIAHDTNNFLAVIQSTLELLSMDTNLTSEAREFVVTAQRSCDNVVHLNRQLVSYSRKQDLVPKELLFSAVLPEVMAFLKSTYSDIILENRITVDPTIVVDQVYLTSSVVNIIKNSAISMSGKGKIVISTSVTVDNFLCVKIEDEGSGFTPEALDEALQPFFSEVNTGTGLGLSSVDGFARQSGGWVKLSNTTGACVELLLPIAQGSKVQNRMSNMNTVGAESSKSKHILLIEDNVDLANLIESYFKPHNLKTHVAHSIRQGLEMLSDTDSAFDIIISDLVLPDGNGVEIALKSFNLGLDLPIILMTGYGDQALKDSDMPFEYSFIQKPFLLHDLKSQAIKLVA